MAVMLSNHEMTIPKSPRVVILQFAVITVVVSFAFLAIVNLYNRTALIGSSLWLALVMMIVRSGCKQDGGFRKNLTNRLGDLLGRRFVESSSQDAQKREICFGY